MGSRFSVQRVAAFVLAAFSLTAAIALPSVASATTFSYKKPASASSSTVTKPKISVYVYDKYGIKGSTSFSMKIDGKTVKPKYTYKKRGDYKRVTVWFQVTTALKIGSHTVVVTIKNTKKKKYSSTWKFTVKSPPDTPPPPPSTDPLPMPVTIGASECGRCHVGYPIAHPMTQCDLCHGGGRPQGYPEYGPGDESAHTLGCSLEVPCHGGGGAFPHKLDADCSRCHSGAVSGIAGNHSIDAEPVHASSSARCTAAGCHLTSLTVEHYRRTIAGVALSCATCHSSTSARVIAAIRSGSTTCESCHSLTAAHAANAAGHQIAGSCSAPGCHVTSAIAIHAAAGGPGCDACHSAGRTPSLVCASCHPGTTSEVHAVAAVAHTASSGTCVTALCHLSDVSAVHDRTGAIGCAACHAPGKTPSTNCVTCHPGALDAIHPRIGAAHTAPIDGCVSATCHARDVTAVHGANGGPGCAACHEAGGTATVSCSRCHSGDLTLRHGSAAAAHTASASNACVGPACHGSGVATLHAAGPGCAACHGPGKTASTTCSPCHSSNLTTVHPAAAAPHTAPASTCVSATCHASNVTTLHAALPKSGCSACHVPGKALTASCASCHTADLVSLHPAADAKHTAPVGTCAQSACHTANVAAIHRALPGSGCSACHGPGKTPSRTCASCHPGDLTPRHTSATAAHTAPASSCVTGGCHGANVASVHGATGGPGCAACHAPGKVPSRTCATCHPGDMTSLHAGAAAAHTAPRSTCVQTGCHATDAASLHTKTGGPGCAACHAAGVVASIVCVNCHTGDLTSRHPGATTAHTAPASSCVTAGCHGANASSVHSAPGGPGCAACHAPGKVPSRTCATCHPGDVASLHASAAAAHTAPRSTCVQIGCHAADAASLHTKTSGPGCAACHATGVVASITCADCHAGDLNPRHTFANTAHTAPAGLCVSSTCHATNVATVHASSLGCVDCHGVGRTPSTLCATCHGGDLVTLHSSIAPKHLAPVTTCVQAGCHARDAAAVHAAAGGPGCMACHAVGKTPSLVCATCHAGGFTTAHPAPTALHTSPANSCVSAGCHAANAATLHTAAGGPGCTACHAIGRTPSLVCANCHIGDIAALHPNALASHSAATGACVTAACHVSDVSAVHGATGGPGCAACHALGKTPSRTCSSCHISDVTALHARAAASHAAPAGSCVKAGCHGSDVATVHGTTGGPGCVACHAVGKTASLVCDSCHAGHGTTLHPATTAAHESPAGSCAASGCHAANVMTIHGEGGGAGCSQCHSMHRQPGTPGCAACHSAGKTLTTRCADCHSGPYTTIHASGDAKHAAPAGSCVKAGCHGADAAALHSVTGGPGCSACHATGKTPSLICSACHPAPFAPPHPAPSSVHTAPTGTCVRSGCHVSDVGAVHGAAGGPGCAACHATGKTPSLNCGACHAPVFGPPHPAPLAAHTSSGFCNSPGAGCHSTFVAAVHGALGGPGCAACHAVGKTPSLICADCHIGGATVAHAPGNVPHTAPTGQCVQAGCHVSNVTTLHHPGPKCAACHAPGVTASVTCSLCHAGDPTSVHAAIIGTRHIAPAGSCAGPGCHAADVATLHGAAGGPGCAACHAAGITPSLTCLTCHGDGFGPTHPVPEAAHTAPAGGPCSGCHAPNVATLHGETGGPSCAACHATGVTPSLACPTCHTANIADTHAIATTAHSPRVHPCAGDCHGTNVATIHATSDRSCAICHASGTATTANCTSSSCHPLEISYAHVNYSMLGEFHRGKSGTGWADWGWESNGTILPPYTRGVSLPCSTCHVAAGTTNEYNFPTVVNGRSVTVTSDNQVGNLCVACHGGTIGDWHQGCFDCHGSGMGGMTGPRNQAEFQSRYGGDCTQCHQHGGYGWPHGPGWMTGATL